MDADFTALADAPCRILMTCDTVGGVWRYAMDLSRVVYVRLDTDAHRVGF